MDKLQFLHKDFISYVQKLDPSTAPLFGKMNVQQMVEHMSESIRIANGKNPHRLFTPEDKLQAMRDFVLSEKDFRPNTKNALLSEEPAPLRNAGMEAAISELEAEINDLIAYFHGKPGHKEMNPFFGELTFEEWLHLFHKHGVHHLRQFGVAI